MSTKISKNIKRLRANQNMSQEALAEKLFISRQAVSSWENDRTQPDIEMIGKLAEILNVSIEELIYGEKRKTVLENEDPPVNRKLIIIFSILGSVFIAVGIIFFIFFGWESFGMGLKTVLGLLPMLSGQSVAVFTYLKKRHSISFSESAALVWSVGVTATVFLINSICGINITEFTLFVVSSLLVLPSIYIFDSVSPLVVYFGLSLSAIANSINDFWSLTFLIISLILGVTYVALNRHKVGDIRHNYSVWITVIAIGIALFELTIAFDSIANYTSYFALFAAYFTSLIAYSKTTSVEKPFYLIGTFGLTVLLFIISFFDSFDALKFAFSNPRFDTESILITFIKLGITLAFITSGVLLNKKQNTKNPLKISILLIGAVATLFALITCDVFVPVAFILVIALAIVFIIIGTKTNRFYELNLGLLTIIASMFRVITELEAEYLAIGFTFFASGMILFTVNFLLLRKAKRLKQLESESSNEELVNGGDLNV